MNFEHLNSVARGSKKMLRRIADLEINALYPIEAIRKVGTKYGDKVIVDLKNDIFCYLPCRVSKDLWENVAARLIEFKNALLNTKISLRPLEGRYSPIEFVPTPPALD